MAKKLRFKNARSSQITHVDQVIANVLGVISLLLLSSGLISFVQTWLFTSRATSAVGEVVAIKEVADDQREETYTGSKVIERKYWAPEIRFQTTDGNSIRFEGPQTYGRRLVQPTPRPQRIPPTPIVVNSEGVTWIGGPIPVSSSSKDRNLIGSHPTTPKPHSSKKVAVSVSPTPTATLTPTPSPSSLKVVGTEKTPSLYTTSNPQKVGDLVLVLYDPKNPNIAVIKQSAGMWDKEVLLLLAGAVLAVVTIMLKVSSKRAIA